MRYDSTEKMNIGSVGDLYLDMKLTWDCMKAMDWDKVDLLYSSE